MTDKPTIRCAKDGPLIVKGLGRFVGTGGERLDVAIIGRAIGVAVEMLGALVAVIGQ